MGVKNYVTNKFDRQSSPAVLKSQEWKVPKGNCKIFSNFEYKKKK